MDAKRGEQIEDRLDQLVVRHEGERPGRRQLSKQQAEFKETKRIALAAGEQHGNTQRSGFFVEPVGKAATDLGAEPPLVVK